MIRITIFMTTDTFTWTESHYHVSATTIAAAATDAASLAAARLKILTKPAAIVGYRLSDTALPRQAQFSPLPGNQWIGSYLFPGTSVIDQYADRPYSVVIPEYVGVNGRTSRGYMAGVPDQIVSEDPEEVGGLDPTFSPGWVKAFNRYMVTLAAAWGWRRISNAGTVPVIGVDTTTHPAGELGVTVGAAINFAGGPVKVNITGFRSVNPRKRGLSGIYSVDQTDATYPPTAKPFTYFLRGTSAANGANLTTQLGSVAPLAYLIEQYASADIIRATHRKRGVSALAPRGRSRSRPC